MVKRNFGETLALIVVALTKAFEAMNLNRPMNDEQIVELAETILDSSNEDLLALEDVVLFLQGLTRGKYGPLYEAMDIPKFMEKFEVYRNERHVALLRVREEQHANFKAMGDTERISDSDSQEKDLTRLAVGNYLREKYKDGPTQ